MKIIFIFCSLFLFSGCEDVVPGPNKDTYILLTWRSQDTSTTMTINFRASEKAARAIVHFGEKSGGGIPSAYEHHIPANKLSVKGLADFRSFQVELNNLKPATTYYFIAGSDEGGYSEEKKFRTLPNDNSPLRFVTGGDMGTDELMQKMLRTAAARSPDFALIGGDIAYANGKTENWKKWLKWLQSWSRYMVTPEGYSIPVALAIGNHETDGAIIKKAPFFRGLLNQSKKTYFIRDFGPNIRFFILDTGHVSPHIGPQKWWLKKHLKRAKKVNIPHRFAIYHIPFYPAHRKYTLFPSFMGRISWKPLFEKYGLQAAFENHDHVLKRTHILKKGKVSKDGKGVVYLGDGCWGKERRSVDNSRWYLKKAQAIEHFWSVDVTDKGVQYNGIDADGNQVDSYYRETVQ